MQGEQIGEDGDHGGEDEEELEESAQSGAKQWFACVEGLPSFC